MSCKFKEAAANSNTCHEIIGWALIKLPENLSNIVIKRPILSSSVPHVFRQSKQANL